MSKNIEKDQVLQAGLCGWLSPDGYFIPACYGTHGEVALALEKSNYIKPIYDNKINHKLIRGERLLELSGYIKFTYRQLYKNTCETYVFFPQKIGYSKDITDKQLDWLESNYFKMNIAQEKYVRLYLSYAYNRK